MSMKPAPPDRLLRRCNSEPPLSSRFALALETRRHGGSSCSFPENATSTKSKLIHSNTKRDRNNNLSAPMLPKLYEKPPTNRLKKTGGHHKVDKHSGTLLPSFTSLEKHNIVTPRQRGIQANKFHLRSRYMIDQTFTQQSDSVEENCSPLRQKVREIVGSKGTQINGNPDKQLACNLVLHPPSSGPRRLSVITEKSSYSKNSKTAIFDLEDYDFEVKATGTPELPSVDTDSTTQKPLFTKKNSQKLQEHVIKTDKQYNPVESKAVLLCNWLKSLQAE
ncbi:uncharacterized protein LOC116609396 [Nematostella vectensis]|uniref:uncharacterized protein LOC116609396 n=1 Tax=Nematostella vectensis TaxID=45351 RepID=UPI00139005D8|nr:uncharacterized protein LOC116609396 [Nematostella vectensis]